jgi:universal stress protein A
MLLYKHVLFAADLSEDTDAVAQRASFLAKRSQAKLSIIHVLEHTPIVYGGGEFSIPLDMSLEEQLAVNARLALGVLSNRLNIPEQNQFIAHGSVKREIIDLAQKINADLIIVGCHGHSGIEMFLGSTANAILHAAKCDVLAVRSVIANKQK